MGAEDSCKLDVPAAKYLPKEKEKQGVGQRGFRDLGVWGLGVRV